MYTFNYCGSPVAVNVRNKFHFIERLSCLVFAPPEFQECLHATNCYFGRDLLKFLVRIP